jgi:hypothetical protein
MQDRLQRGESPPCITYTLEETARLLWALSAALQCVRLVRDTLTIDRVEPLIQLTVRRWAEASGIKDEAVIQRTISRYLGAEPRVHRPATSTAIAAESAEKGAA